MRGRATKNALHCVFCKVTFSNLYLFFNEYLYICSRHMSCLYIRNGLGCSLGQAQQKKKDYLRFCILKIKNSAVYQNEALESQGDNHP